MFTSKEVTFQSLAEDINLNTIKFRWQAQPSSNTVSFSWSGVLQIVRETPVESGFKSYGPPTPKDLSCQLMQEGYMQIYAVQKGSGESAISWGRTLNASMSLVSLPKCPKWLNMFLCNRVKMLNKGNKRERRTRCHSTLAIQRNKNLHHASLS